MVPKVVFNEVDFFYVKYLAVYGTQEWVTDQALCVNLIHPLLSPWLIWTSKTLCLCAFKCVIQMPHCGTRLCSPPKEL